MGYLPPTVQGPPVPSEKITEKKTHCIFLIHILDFSSSDNHNHFKLPAGLKIRLCRGLDQAPNKSLNDWRALAAALRLETGYFQSRSSPTECILTLWEVQQQQASYANNDSSVNPLVDLLNLLRVIGRQDAALMVEKDFGPWI